jgi:hypothetical protein
VQPMDESRRQFLDLLTQASGKAAPMTLVLSKYQGDEPELLRVQARPVVIRGAICLSFVYRYRSRDVTANLPLPQALQRVDELLGDSFRQANLRSGALEAQLGFSKRGKALLRTSRGAGRPAADAAEDETKGAGGKQDEVDAEAQGGATGDRGVVPAVPATVAHNREKHRLLSLERPFLRALGVTDSRGHLIPSMARKWKQINRFIEVFADAWRSSGLQQREAPLRVIDFGAGKGYLTFALHDYLRTTLEVDCCTHGVDLRGDLVKTCNDAVAALGIEGLAFSQGDIASHRAHPLQSAPGGPAYDVMIALHACDTATDDAIHQGIRAGAAIIMCAPCCHKQLRPQLLSPHPLRPILQHGIHLGQEAEMVTDGLRAMLLEACGYETQVFEFISLEHTSKNKMILAVKRGTPRSPGPILAQIEEVKSFYGIREQRLESLLLGEPGGLAGQGDGRDR